MPNPLTFEETIKIIAEWIRDKKTGNIQLNFFNGTISNANLTQCIKGGMEDVHKNQKVVKLTK